MISKIYLSIYNLLLFLGWFYLLVHFVVESFRTNFFTALQRQFESNSNIIHFLQFLNLFDIVNAMAGLWGESEISMFWRLYCKVLRRIQLYPALLLIQEVHVNTWLGLTLLSWMISDVIRYPFYLLNTWKICPKWLKWLRYSNFYYQYPLNIISETQLFILMAPYILEREIFFIHFTFQNEKFVIFNYLYFEILWKSHRILKFIKNYSTLNDEYFSKFPGGK
jgi:hypothetical protein